MSFGSAGADAIADTQIKEVVDIFFAYTRYHSAYRRERDDLGVLEEHVRTHEGCHLVDCFFRKS